MVTFTSSLPKHLINKLNQAAKVQKLPKNKLIEKALEIYLDQLNKAEYIKSYKNLVEEDVVCMAEEGMKEYMAQLIDHEAS